ncbi:putative flavanone 7-O-beta-glucosyltransferase [Dioscorea sansibarensis]
MLAPCRSVMKDGKRRWREDKLSHGRSWLRLAWLDEKPAGSVLYVCFGSLSEISSDQVKELALGLEASGCWFVWAVRGNAVRQLPASIEEWLGRGSWSSGWAPQLLILGHVAIGGFLTHCGWNSTLEGISAGVPMVTWPLTYEQLVNGKFLNKVETWRASERGVVGSNGVGWSGGGVELWSMRKWHVPC